MLVSSNYPVAAALKSLLENKQINNLNNNNQIINLYTTKINGELEEKAKRFNINVSNVGYLDLE